MFTEQLDRLCERRNDVFALRLGITDLVAAENRTDLTREETEKFEALSRQLAQLDQRITEVRQDIKRSGQGNPSATAARRAQSRVEAVREARTYEAGNGQSYFKDLILSQRNMDATGQATERLRRHAIDVDSGTEYRAIDTTDGSGGYFVPPAHLVDQYAPLARAGRATADICTRLPLPANTNVLNIPKVTSGTDVDFQYPENTPIHEDDIEDASIAVPVRTIAGGQDVSLQLLEQSPINFDDVVIQDLLAAHAAKLDTAVLAGTGTSGTIKGVHNTAGIGTVAITGPLSVEKLYAGIADAIQKIHTTRFLPPSHIVMHPRRWAYFTAAVDGDKRPLVLPSGRSVNNMATLDGVVSQQVVGELQGLPVVTDPNIGTGYGTADNEDLAYVVRASDMLLWENTPRVRVLPQISGKSLTVHIQLYSYAAFTVERYPTSVVEITGLTAPTFG